MQKITGQNHPDFLIDDILGIGDDLESDTIPGQRALKISTRRKMQRIGQQQALHDVLPEPPGQGESIHIISAALFDFWTWVPAMVGWIGRVDELLCSTWTLSRQNAVELFELWDRGGVAPGRVAFLSGLYFKRRETAVYSMLLDGLRARGGRYRAFKNHCKILLLCNAEREAWLTVTGSANLTSNPRSEQYTITNDRTLYQFYKGWFEEMLSTHKPEPEATPT